METEIIDEIDELLTNVMNKHTIVLYNDDVNSFQHVIACLMLILKHTMEQAEQCAMITHTKGKCDVKSGTYEDMLVLSQMLNNAGLSTQIE